MWASQSCARSPGTVGLISSSCPSAPVFSPRFFQTAPRDAALALHYPFSSIKMGRGLSPPSYRTCSAHTKAAPVRCTGAANSIQQSAKRLSFEDQRENNNERKQRQRFYEYQSKNHGGADRIGRSGISRHAFAGGRSDFRLCVAATCGRQRHAERARNCEPIHTAGRCCSAALGEHAGSQNQNGDQRKYYSCCLLHFLLLVMNLPPGGGSRHPRAAGLTL